MGGDRGFGELAGTHNKTQEVQTRDRLRERERGSARNGYTNLKDDLLATRRARQLDEVVGRRRAIHWVATRVSYEGVGKVLVHHLCKLRLVQVANGLLHWRQLDGLQHDRLHALHRHDVACADLDVVACRGAKGNVPVLTVATGACFLARCCNLGGCVKQAEQSTHTEHVVWCGDGEGGTFENNDSRSQCGDRRQCTGKHR